MRLIIYRFIIPYRDIEKCLSDTNIEEVSVNRGRQKYIQNKRSDAEASVARRSGQSFWRLYRRGIFFVKQRFLVKKQHFGALFHTELTVKYYFFSTRCLSIPFFKVFYQKKRENLIKLVLKFNNTIYSEDWVVISIYCVEVLTFICGVIANSRKYQI